MKMNRIIHTISLHPPSQHSSRGCSKSEGGDNGGIPEGCDTFGYVTDNSGAPIQGVVVSDGYTCAQTDAQGLYKLTRNTLAYYVYYSIPAGYEVNIGKTSDMPEFYTRLGSRNRPLRFPAQAARGSRKGVPAGLHRRPAGKRRG